MTTGITPDPTARVLQSSRAFEGNLLKIDIDRVLLPNGATAQLETVRHPGAAAALPFLPNGKVVLIQQYRHSIGGYILEIPAGKLEEDETPEECVIREAEEEVGYRVGRLEDLGAIFPTPGYTDEIIWLYEAHDLKKTEVAHEANEVIEVVEVPFAEAVSQVLDGRIRDTKSVAAILHAQLRRQ